MKRFIFFITLILSFQISLMAQKSTTNQAAPKENIHVNREYDENGNLIKFDSVYSYSWSGDTTLLKSVSPTNFQDPFNDHFGLFPDSTFFGNSFFDDLDKLFPSPFNNLNDSILMQKFGLNHHSQNFKFNNDSITDDFNSFDDSFNNFGMNKNDSISAKSHSKSPLHAKPNSMNDMMQMLQQQMKEMEEYQRKFF